MSRGVANEVNRLRDPPGFAEESARFREPTRKAAAGQRVGIVVTNLERNTIRCTLLLREGLVPGWQYAGDSYAAAVNVSYGQKLADYPAVSIALLVLHWLNRGLSSSDISLLLRTSVLGSNQVAGRSRLELKLRQWPDRA